MNGMCSSQSTIFSDYKTSIVNVFDKIIEDSGESIVHASKCIAEYIAGNNNIVHLVSTGLHANSAIDDVFWRAGGLASLNPLFSTGFNLYHGAKRANYRTTQIGYAKHVFDDYEVGKTPGEIIIILSAYGINTASIDFALEAKKREMMVIGITSQVRANGISLDHTARHPSKKSLYHLSDHFINCHPPYEDTVLNVKSMHQRFGATTGFCLMFSLHLLINNVIFELSSKGFNPPVWQSVVLADDNNINAALEEMYSPKVRHLI